MQSRKTAAKCEETAAEGEKTEELRMDNSKICFSCKAEKICGSSVTAYSAGCMENMRIYIHDKKKFRKILKDVKEKAESGR